MRNFAARNLPKWSEIEAENGEKDEDQLSPTSDDLISHLDYTPPRKNLPVHN